MALKITCFAYAGVTQSCLANHFRVWYGVTKWSGGVNAIISYGNVTFRWLDGCESHSRRHPRWTIELTMYPAYTRKYRER